jgi:hypothetical protein
MPYRYSAELRVRIRQRMFAGEKVATLASELHLSPGTLHPCNKQALIDSDLLTVRVPTPSSCGFCPAAQTEVSGGVR